LKLDAAKDPVMLQELKDKVEENESATEREKLEKDLKEVKAAISDTEATALLQHDLQERKTQAALGKRQVIIAKSGCMGMRAFDAQVEVDKIQDEIVAHEAAKVKRSKNKANRINRSESDRAIETAWEVEWNDKHNELLEMKNEANARNDVLNQVLRKEKKAQEKRDKRMEKLTKENLRCRQDGNILEAHKVEKLIEKEINEETHKKKMRALQEARLLAEQLKEQGNIKMACQLEKLLVIEQFRASETPEHHRSACSEAKRVCSKLAHLELYQDVADLDAAVTVEKRRWDQVNFLRIMGNILGRRAKAEAIAPIKDNFEAYKAKVALEAERASMLEQALADAKEGKLLANEAMRQVASQKQQNTELKGRFLILQEHNQELEVMIAQQIQMTGNAVSPSPAKAAKWKSLGSATKLGKSFRAGESDSPVKVKEEGVDFKGLDKQIQSAEQAVDAQKARLDQLQKELQATASKPAKEKKMKHIEEAMKELDNRMAEVDAIRETDRIHDETFNGGLKSDFQRVEDENHALRKILAATLGLVQEGDPNADENYSTDVLLERAYEYGVDHRHHRDVKVPTMETHITELRGLLGLSQETEPPMASPPETKIEDGVKAPPTSNPKELKPIKREMPSILAMADDLKHIKEEQAMNWDKMEKANLESVNKCLEMMTSVEDRLKTELPQHLVPRGDFLEFLNLMRSVLSGEADAEPGQTRKATAIESSYPSLPKVLKHLQKIGGWMEPMSNHVHGVDSKEVKVLQAQLENLNSLIERGAESFDTAVEVLVPGQLISVRQQASMKVRKGFEFTEEDGLQAVLDESIMDLEVNWAGNPPSKETVSPQQFGNQAVRALTMTANTYEVLQGAEAERARLTQSLRAYQEACLGNDGKYVSKDPQNDAFLSELESLINKTDEEEDKLGLLMRQIDIVRKEAANCWERCWRSLCLTTRDSIRGQEEIREEIERMREELVYDDAPVLSAIEGLVKTTYKHEEDISYCKEAAKALADKARKILEELSRKASKDELMVAMNGAERAMAALSGAIEKRIERTDFVNAVEAVREETHQMIGELEHMSSGELDREKDRQDVEVRELKRMIDEKTALSANAASSSAFACLACNQPVPMMPIPQRQPSPQSSRDRSRDQKTLHGGFELPMKGMPTPRAHTAQPRARGHERMEDTVKEQMAAFGNGIEPLPPRSPRDRPGSRETPKPPPLRLEQPEMPKLESGETGMSAWENMGSRPSTADSRRPTSASAEGPAWTVGTLPLIPRPAPSPRPTGRVIVPKKQKKSKEVVTSAEKVTDGPIVMPPVSEDGEHSNTTKMPPVAEEPTIEEAPAAWGRNKSPSMDPGPKIQNPSSSSGASLTEADEYLRVMENLKSAVSQTGDERAKRDNQLLVETSGVDGIASIGSSPISPPPAPEPVRFPEVKGALASEPSQNIMQPNIIDAPIVEKLPEIFIDKGGKESEANAEPQNKAVDKAITS